MPNLGVPVNRPQPAIELARAWGIARKRRPTSWVNFEAWLALGDHLDRHERMFLDCDCFFESDAVRTFFGEVRAGERRLYDGNETFSFLSLARFVQPQAEQAAVTAADAAQPGWPAFNPAQPSTAPRA